MPSSNFKVLRQSGRFVDKTLFLKHLHELKKKVYVIFRPHRFGKTVIAEMTDCFYRLELDEHGNEVPQAERTNLSFFQGTEIWNDVDMMSHMGNYPLIHLRFNKIRWANFEGGLKEVMKAAYEEYGLHLPLPDDPKTNLEELLERLIQILNKRYKRSVVVIIDEFDTPLNCLLLEFHQQKKLTVECAKLRKFAQKYCHLIEAVVRQQVEFALLLGNLHLSYFPLLNSDDGVFPDQKLSTVTQPNRLSEDFGFSTGEIFYMCFPKILESHTVNAMRKWYGGLTPNNSMVELFTPHSVTSCIESGFVMDNFADLSKYPLLFTKHQNMDAIINILEKLLANFDLNIIYTSNDIDVDRRPIRLTDYSGNYSLESFTEILLQHGLVSHINCCSAGCASQHLSVTNEECKLILWKKFRLACLVKQFDLNRSNYTRRGLVDSISNYKWSPKFTAHLEKYALKILEI